MLLVWATSVIIIVAGLTLGLLALPASVWFLVFTMPVLAGSTLGLLALPASVWLAVFSGHLFGQISRKAEISTT